MKNSRYILFLTLITILYPFPSSAYMDKAISTYFDLSTELIESVMEGSETREIEEKLISVSLEDLSQQLDTDDKKKTFWINIYNSFVIIQLKKEPELYTNRGNFFSAKKINIANQYFSFDDIEHGILRKSSIKLGLGVIKDLFPGKRERLLRVDKKDPRIHFALNCGAKSCPPVRSYSAELIDQQMEEASEAYLKKISKYSAENNSLQITPLMSWFRGDFGGKKGSLLFVKKYSIIPKTSKPELSFLSYDWSIDIDNFVK